MREMHKAMPVIDVRNAMIDSYNRYAQGLDSKDWPMVRSCFADEVFIDYGSISDPTGSPDVARKSDDWLQILQGVINGFDITRHMITNHRPVISDSELACSAYLMADHVIFQDPAVQLVSPDDVVTVVGEYTNWFEPAGSGLQICRSRLVVNYTRGNPLLLGQAIERTALQGHS